MRRTKRFIACAATGRRHFWSKPRAYGHTLILDVNMWQIPSEFMPEESITTITSPEFLKQHGKPALPRTTGMPPMCVPRARWDWLAVFEGTLPAYFHRHFQ